MFGRIKHRLFAKPGDQRKILLYGLQRSGTNYLESLVEINYPACQFINGEMRNEITHKHFRLYADKSRIPEPQFQNQQVFDSFAAFESALPEIPDLYIVVSKDPYSWLVSYNKWSKKNNWPLPDYQYIEEYNLFYGMWMQFSKQTDKVLFVRYIDLLTDPQKEMERVTAALNLPARTSTKTTSKVYASRKFTAGRKESFLNKEHMQDISKETLSEVNHLLDKQLIQFLHYPLETK